MPQAPVLGNLRTDGATIITMSRQHHFMRFCRKLTGFMPKINTEDHIPPLKCTLPVLGKARLRVG
jgi:hypothetical protein